MDISQYNKNKILTNIAMMEILMYFEYYRLELSPIIGSKTIEKDKEDEFLTPKDHDLIKRALNGMLTPVEITQIETQTTKYLNIKLQKMKLEHYDGAWLTEIKSSLSLPVSSYEDHDKPSERSVLEDPSKSGFTSPMTPLEENKYVQEYFESDTDNNDELTVTHNQKKDILFTNASQALRETTDPINQIRISLAQLSPLMTNDGHSPARWQDAGSGNQTMTPLPVANTGSIYTMPVNRTENSVVKFKIDNHKPNQSDMGTNLKVIKSQDDASSHPIQTGNLRNNKFRLTVNPIAGIEGGDQNFRTANSAMISVVSQKAINKTRKIVKTREISDAEISHSMDINFFKYNTNPSGQNSPNLRDNNNSDKKSEKPVFNPLIEDSSSEQRHQTGSDNNSPELCLHSDTPIIGAKPIEK